MARRGAVGEEEDLLARLVSRLEWRAPMDDDDPARLDVHPLPRLAEQHGQRASERDEDLFLIEVEVPPPARVRRIAPHPRPRLGHPGGLAQRGRVSRLLALVSGPFLPLEVALVDDIPGHGPTIPSAPMAEPRPAALPPAERTIGQLIAESIQFYGAHFAACLVLGVPAAAVAVVFTNVSHRAQLLLAPTLSAGLISATFVWACAIVLGASPPRRRLVAAWLMGWLVFAPVPFLVLAFVVPGLLWLAAFGLVVPVLVREEVPLRAALPRAWRLARADFVHALGSVFTLAVVVVLSQSVLVFILRGFGDAGVSTALFLASVVLSPLLFVGTALLYVDQSARTDLD
jgi:hypothetical protein